MSLDQSFAKILAEAEKLATAKGDAFIAADIMVLAMARPRHLSRR